MNYKKFFYRAQFGDNIFSILNRTLNKHCIMTCTEKCITLCLHILFYVRLINTYYL